MAVLATLTVLASCSTDAGTTSVVGPAGSASSGGSGGSGGSDGGADSGDASAGSTIVWGACGEATLEGERCATLEVPLDYGEPAGPTIELALNVLPARNRAERVGVLLVNPGGPGASGIDYARSGPWSAALLSAFDVVGFDPRGVKRSSPIDCLSDAELEYLFSGPSAPTTDAQVTAVVEASSAAEEQCASDPAGPLLGTRNVARDMDEIRKALGEEQISFYGASYGSSIGSAYVDLFPERVRALVVDSVVSPTASTAQEATDQAASFETLLGQFVTWCAEREGTCPEDPEGSITALIARADADPIPVPAYDGELSGTLAVLGVITAFYSQDIWGFLGDALQRADQGDAEGIYQLSTFQTERSQDGTYTNLREALLAVVCSDVADRLTLDQARALAADLGARYPTFGAAAAWGSFGCLGWPTPVDPMVPPDSDGSATVLIVGTVDDPATPYQGAVDMRKALENSVLLTYEGSGHVAYSTSECVAEAVDRYLIDLDAPEDGTICTS